MAKENQLIAGMNISISQILQDFATGSTCNQCKANTFYLNSKNSQGCISCFCSGVTDQCDSSRYYRQQVTASFVRDTQGFKLQEYSTGAFVDSGIHVDTTERELVYQDFNSSPPQVGFTSWFRYL